MSGGYLIVALGVAQSEALTPAAKLVYACLRFAAGRSGTECSPSVKKIRANCGLSDRQVRTALRKLYELKLIEVARTNGMASSYQLKPDATGFLPIPLAVARSETLTPAAKLAYGALHRLVKGDSTTPRKWICAYTHLCLRTVAYSIGALQKEKVLEVSRTPGNHPNRYRLLVLARPAERQPAPDRGADQPAAAAAAPEGSAGSGAPSGAGRTRRLTRREREDAEILKQLDEAQRNAEIRRRQEREQQSAARPPP